MQRAVSSVAVKRTSDEQRELKLLPQQIEKLEAKIAALHAQMGDEGFYQQVDDKVQSVVSALANHEKELSALYARWEALEG